MSETAKAKRDARTRRRRAEILAAAYEVFAAKGYHQTNIADIAAELGIGHGTFYRYFSNKLDIFKHVIAEVIRRVGADVSREDPKASTRLEEYRDQVRRIGTRLFDLMEQDQPLASILFYEALGIDEEINKEVQRAWDVFGTMTALYLKNGKDRGFLRQDLDTETTALAINSMIFEGGRRLMHSEDKEKEKERWLSAVISLMFDGVRDR